GGERGQQVERVADAEVGDAEVIVGTLGGDEGAARQLLLEQDVGVDLGPGLVFGHGGGAVLLELAAEADRKYVLVPEVAGVAPEARLRVEQRKQDAAGVERARVDGRDGRSVAGAVAVIEGAEQVLELAARDVTPHDRAVAAAE